MRFGSNPKGESEVEFKSVARRIISVDTTTISRGRRQGSSSEAISNQVRKITVQC